MDCGDEVLRKLQSLEAFLDGALNMCNEENTDHVLNLIGYKVRDIQEIIKANKESFQSQRGILAPVDTNPSRE